MGTRVKQPPLTADAADALTGRHLDVLVARAVWPYPVYAVRHQDYERFEDRTRPPDWDAETDPEKFEAWWIPERAKSVRWSTHRNWAKQVPHFSCNLGAAWPLLLDLEKHTRHYELGRDPSRAWARLTPEWDHTGWGRYSECASENPGDRITEAQCIAICRAVVRAVCWLRDEQSPAALAKATGERADG